MVRSLGQELRFLISLLSRYARPKAFFPEALNQFCRILRMSKAYRLTTIGLEITNTCNLQCLHCPSPQAMKRKKGIMKLTNFRKIIDLNPEVKRVYLTNWGEPLLHPDLAEMIRYARLHGRATAITTNGTVLNDSLTQKLLESGLNLIKFSVDGNRTTYEKIRGFDYNQLKSNILRFIKARDELRKKTRVEVSMTVSAEMIPEIDSFYREWSKVADFVNIQPQFFSIKKKRPGLCQDLWRILVVLWDGKVVPCCVDYDGELVLGDATETSLQNLFKGPCLTELRKKHLKRESLPPLCQRCSPYFSGYHLSERNLFF